MADDLSELELAEEDPELIPKKWKKYKLLILVLGSNLLITGAIVGIILFAPSVISESWKFWGSKGTRQEEQKIAEEKGKETPKVNAEAVAEKAPEEPTKKDPEEAIPKPSGEPAKMAAEESSQKSSEEAAQKSSEDDTQKAAKKVRGHIYKTEGFLVNLADVDRPKYLKLKINIESNESKPNEEYEKRMPQLRDAVLTIISNKRQKDIFDSEGKQKLREEMITQLNQLLQGFKVQTIYFTEFMIQ